MSTSKSLGFGKVLCPRARAMGTTVRVEYGDDAIASDSSGPHVISHVFPHTYGVGIVFYGRQSPGGHNVVWRLDEAIKAHYQNIKLTGFLGGSDGLLAQRTLDITNEVFASYKNQGGYDMLVLNIHCIPLLLQAEDLCMMYRLFSKISHGLVPISNMFKTILVSLAGCLSSLLAHSFYSFEP
ncbi:Pyrophosphate--fructose 6-phosphate 1-phosphotransferase subunit alpha 2 [Zea mays]|uniref:Pyrophosphate--fructose 6-phosphate 1-phosphotransferase subunit alpha 2 n=1 Tax=Zea mays TaxID=4577 RepID=A0A1D6H2M6_MAIZE|nr:Pyrophosphate--fructose 6-phosphate 1-phosphotransferase subunit alpha 2 [Zea mays]